jgi:TRAP-type C4-dicarboxylate transport system permease small subunit
MAGQTGEAPLMEDLGEGLGRVAFLDSVVRWVSRLCDKIAQAGLFAMLLLTTSNIVLRKVVGKPIYGAYDYVCFLSTIVVAFAIANCAVQRGHTQVELLVARFSRRAQGIVDSITGILSLGIFSLITWQSIVLANDMRRAGEVSMTSLEPFYPYIYAIAFGCALLCLVILVDIMKSAVKAVKG